MPEREVPGRVAGGVVLVGATTTGVPCQVPDDLAADTIADGWNCWRRLTYGV